MEEIYNDRKFNNKNSNYRSIKKEEIYIDGKFNNKNSKYRPIKITNICLLVIFMLVDFFFSAVEGRTFNPLPSLITFWIAVYFIRLIFIKNPEFKYKVLITIVVYVASYILKNLIFFLLLSLIFGTDFFNYL